MPKQKLVPADLVAKRFGGSRELSRLLGGSEYRVSAWKSKGGAIPNTNQMHKQLLSLAKQKGVKLTERELIYGGAP